MLLIYNLLVILIARDNNLVKYIETWERHVRKK